MSKYYDFPCFNIVYLTDAKIKHYVSLMQQKYILYWQHTMQNLNFSIEDRQSQSKD